MLKDIKRFYEKAKMKKVINPDKSGEAPLSHIKVFHKGYPRFKSIPLSHNSTSKGLESLVQQRESALDFSPEPISFQELSTILNSCRILDHTRYPERRTYPSAGGRFPIEQYVLSFNIKDLEEGAYHYNILENSLESLWNKGILESKSEIVTHERYENVAAALIYTSVFSRSEVKYFNKAYPFSLLEAGHMAQNVQLACAERGIGVCNIGGAVEDTISKILDLTENEKPLYVTALGKKRK